MIYSYDFCPTPQVLFGSIGKLNGCKLDYDKFGRSLGSATVIYENLADAKRAVSEYNGIDFNSFHRG
jgi:RNA recognition motif-containing protein